MKYHHQAEKSYMALEKRGWIHCSYVEGTRTGSSRTHQTPTQRLLDALARCLQGEQLTVTRWKGGR